MAERSTSQTEAIKSFLDNLTKTTDILSTRLDTPDGFSIDVRSTQAFRDSFCELHQNLPLTFMMSGTSESGKSHFGTTLVKEGVATRFKILRLTRELFTGAVDNPAKFLENLPPAERDEIGKKIVSGVCSKLVQFDTPIATIETISYPWLVQAFKEYQGIRALSIFIDAPLAMRTRRESKKRGLDQVEIAQSISLKDANKMSSGLEEIREITDIIVANAGSIQTYTDFVRNLGNLALIYTPKFSGTPFEFK